MSAYGFLAIWCEIGAYDLGDYRNWLTQEHIADRTVLPGFLGVRLFEAPDNPCAHFILYATQTPEVLHGADYARVLDTPSEWTRRIMPRFGPFDRALGKQVIKLGNGVGTHVVVLKLQTPAADQRRLHEGIGRLANLSGVVALRLGQLDSEVTDRHSEEKTMRGAPEGQFDHLLCLEALSDEGAAKAEEAVRAALDAMPGVACADIDRFSMIYGEAPHELPS